MTKEQLKILVKANLTIEDENKDLIINDAIALAGEYCNITEFPDAIEPVIRRKVKNIIDYESNSTVNGSIFDVKSITEGDSSITYNVDEKHSKDTIYDLSETDKRALKKFRRLRR